MPEWRALRHHCQKSRACMCSKCEAVKSVPHGQAANWHAICSEGLTDARAECICLQQAAGDASGKGPVSSCTGAWCAVRLEATCCKLSGASTNFKAKHQKTSCWRDAGEAPAEQGGQSTHHIVRANACRGAGMHARDRVSTAAGFSQALHRCKLVWVPPMHACMCERAVRRRTMAPACFSRTVGHEHGHHRGARKDPGDGCRSRG